MCCGWNSRFPDRMNQDDRAFGQQLLRVILGNPQLQNALAQAICPKAVTALLQNESFKSGCIQQVARTFEQNQQVFLQACAAPNMDASRTDKPAPDGSSDIYGINIPVELCEDASLDFALNVNAFMEAKFEGKECSTTWYENTATTYSKILNGPKAVLVGLLSAIFIHSETWRSIVIKTGSLGLVAKPVCTITSMEVWFSANVIGRETASARMQKEYVKLRDNHRGRVRMQNYRDKVKKESSVDTTATNAPPAPTKTNRPPKRKEVRTTDTASTQPQTTSVSPVNLPTTSQNPLATPRGNPEAVTVSPLITREAVTTAPREARAAPPTMRANGSNVVVPSSAPASVTEGGAPWRSRKTVATGGQSVEQMLTILARHRPSKALSPPTKPVEAEDEESEGDSCDENELRLDAVEELKSDVTSEHSNPFDSGDDKSDLGEDDDIVEEEAEDDDVESVVENVTLPLPKKSRNSSKGRGKVAKEVIAKAPSKDKGKKANVQKKKAVASGVTKRVPVDISVSSTVNAGSFYVTANAKDKPQPMRQSARKSRAPTNNPK